MFNNILLQHRKPVDTTHKCATAVCRGLLVVDYLLMSGCKFYSYHFVRICFQDTTCQNV